VDWKSRVGRAVVMVTLLEADFSATRSTLRRPATVNWGTTTMRMLPPVLVGRKKVTKAH